MQVTGEPFAIALFVIMIAGIVIINPLWALLTIFTPKRLLQRYFKEPHFTFGETIMMKQFPGSFVRTAIFGWILCLAPFGYRSFRNLHTIRDAMPAWYAFGLRFLTFYVVATAVSLAILFAILFLYPFPETAAAH